MQRPAAEDDSIGAAERYGAEGAGDGRAGGIVVGRAGVEDAGVDIGRAAVGVRSAQRERAAAELGQPHVQSRAGVGDGGYCR